MTDLPDGLRDRAVNAAFDAWSRNHVFAPGRETWRAVVDAVAEVVLAGHQAEAALRVDEQRVAHRRELAEVKSERDRYKEAWRSEVNRLLDDMDRKLSKQRKRRKTAEARVAELEELDRRLTPRSRLDEFNKLRDQLDEALVELKSFRERIISALGITPHSEQTVDWLVCAVRAANDVADEAQGLRGQIAELEASRDKLEWATHEILKRRGEVDVERDQLSLMLRRMARRVGERRDECHHYATRLMEAYDYQNDLRAKLDKQRKRRKAAEAKVIVLEAMIRSYRDCLLLTRRQLDDTRKELPDE